MKALSILVLLCSAASTLEELTCSVESAAAKIAVDHINEHHHHGYKFNLTAVELYETDLNEEVCIMKMRLNLTETNCHVVNPKSYEDCESRHVTGVIANCNVEIHVKENGSSVNKYDCVTKRVNMDRCMDCPVRISLSDQTGLSSVSIAMTDFNKNISNDHYYTLHEIGRMEIGYLFAGGLDYFAEFVLVETHCLRGTRIVPEACRPLCPDRAYHAFCKSIFNTLNWLISLKCEFYPPKNTTVLEKEPLCPRPHPYPYPGGAPLPGPPGRLPPHGPRSGPLPLPDPGGPPPPAGPGGSPPPAGPVGPPPPAGPVGPPPPAGPGGSPPPAGPVGPPSHRHGVHPPPCVGLLEYDHALHPICPWPVPEISPDPRPSDS